MGGDGRTFQYWHINPLVAVGAHVDAQMTVLGHILRGQGHVHLTEIDGSVTVDPLQPGHLTPYADTTTPTVSSIRFRAGVTGKDLMPELLRGRLELLASVSDMPTLHVQGAWHDLPVMPALVTWEIQRAATGKVVVPQHTAYDVRDHLPAPTAFWQVYARGTHQNMSVFGEHYSYMQPACTCSGSRRAALILAPFRTACTSSASRPPTSAATTPRPCSGSACTTSPVWSAREARLARAGGLAVAGAAVVALRSHGSEGVHRGEGGSTRRRRLRVPTGRRTASTRRARTPCRTARAAVPRRLAGDGDWSLIEFPPVLAGGRLFVGTNHGLLLALDTTTGRRLWQRSSDGASRRPRPWPARRSWSA